MTDSTIIRYLKIVGWVAIISYPFSRLFQLIGQYELLRPLESKTEYLLTFGGTQLIGLFIDAPLNLALPLLCLFAAAYMNNKPETLKNIFE